MKTVRHTTKSFYDPHTVFGIFTPIAAVTKALKHLQSTIEVSKHREIQWASLCISIKLEKALGF